MTQQQFIEEIKRLTVAERIALLETILRSVREDVETGSDVRPAGAKVVPPADQDELERKAAAIRRLRGALKFDGPAPSDEEVKDIITDYLTEKYS